MLRLCGLEVHSVRNSEKGQPEPDSTRMNATVELNNCVLSDVNFTGDFHQVLTTLCMVVMNGLAANIYSHIYASPSFSTPGFSFKPALLVHILFSRVTEGK